MREGMKLVRIYKEMPSGINVPFHRAQTPQLPNHSSQRWRARAEFRVHCSGRQRPLRHPSPLRHPPASPPPAASPRAAASPPPAGLSASRRLSATRRPLRHPPPLRDPPASPPPPGLSAKLHRRRPRPPSSGETTECRGIRDPAARLSATGRGVDSGITVPPSSPEESCGSSSPHHPPPVVMNTNNGPEQRLHPVILSKICTSAVKESLTNTYGDRFESFMRNFDNSFSSTLRTLHRINEIQRSPIPECSFKHEGSAAVDNLSTVDSHSRTHEVKQDIANSVESQLVLYARDSQQLAHIARSRSSPEADRCILNAFERSVKEQARSNELKEYEIGLSMRKLQLKQSQLALSSYSHILEKIKLTLGFQKASFQGEKFKTQMQDTSHTQILRTLIDFLVSAVIIMSACFAYGTYIYSYQRITDVTAACSVASRGSKSWWVPNSVSNFNSGLLFIRCHVIAATRMCFGILMILAIAWLAFQRSAMTGSSMPITFNFILLGVICGFAGRFCANTLGGNGNIWLICWEVLCFIHLLSNCYPSVLYRILHGPISITRSKEVVWLPYWVRRFIFYAVLGLIIPVLTGLLPFASLSDWKDHFVQEIKSFLAGDKIEA